MTMFPLDDEASEFWAECGGRGFRRAKWPKTREAYLEARKHASKEEIFGGMRAFKKAHHDTPWQYLPHSYNWLRDMQWKDFEGVEMEPKHLTYAEQRKVIELAGERVRARRNGG